MPSNYLKYNTYIVCFLFFLVKSKQYEFHFFSFFSVAPGNAEA